MFAPAPVGTQQDETSPVAFCAGREEQRAGIEQMPLGLFARDALLRGGGRRLTDFLVAPAAPSRLVDNIIDQRDLTDVR